MDLFDIKLRFGVSRSHYKSVVRFCSSLVWLQTELDSTPSTTTNNNNNNNDNDNDNDSDSDNDHDNDNIILILKIYTAGLSMKWWSALYMRHIKLDRQEKLSKPRACWYSLKPASCLVLVYCFFFIFVGNTCSGSSHVTATFTSMMVAPVGMLMRWSSLDSYWTVVALVWKIILTRG